VVPENMHTKSFSSLTPHPSGFSIIFRGFYGATPSPGISMNFLLGPPYSLEIPYSQIPRLHTLPLKQH